MEPTDRDLDLAVELVNTYWVLAAPPDRLTDTAVYQRILHDSGDGDLAAQLVAGDLAELRRLRVDLEPVFAAATIQDAVDHLDPLLADAAVTARLAVGDAGVRWSYSSDKTGVAALRGRLLAALATHLIRHGAQRMGVCQAAPCNCVYIDRSRARTRRYCCDQCNDRAAASAYRRRQTT
jgi:predicted RNA-binding Zn ribbon-like protein